MKAWSLRCHREDARVWLGDRGEKGLVVEDSSAVPGNDREQVLGNLRDAPGGGAVSRARSPCLESVLLENG